MLTSSGKNPRLSKLGTLQRALFTWIATHGGALEGIALDPGSPVRDLPAKDFWATIDETLPRHLAQALRTRVRERLHALEHVGERLANMQAKQAQGLDLTETPEYLEQLLAQARGRTRVLWAPDDFWRTYRHATPTTTDRQNISKALRKLEQRGLISRIDWHEGKAAKPRTRWVQLTPTGYELAQHDFMRMIAQQLPPDGE